VPGIIFEDDFDLEVEGTSPPANIINQNLDVCEVDDAQARSLPHSCLLARTVADGYCRIPVSFTDDLVVIWTYVSFQAGHKAIELQKTNAVRSGADEVLTLRYNRANTNIEYYVAGWIDTGYNVLFSSWKELKIKCDFIGKTLDIWYDGNLIVDDGAFRDNTATSVESIQLGVNGATGEFWIDDIQVGEVAPTVGHGLLLSSHRNRLAGVV